ncbi:MAG: S41 family peptidase, partial [Planctomycetota bacterium]
MKPGTAVLVILPLVAVVAAFVLVATRGAGAGSATEASGWDPEIEAFVRDQVARTYVDELDPARGADAFYKAMDGYVHDLDEYSDFIPPEEYRKWKEDTAGEYAGLGVKIQAQKDGLLVVGVLPGGPASTSGIQPGDTLVAADGQPLAGLDLDMLEATRLLKGVPGSTVDVTVVPGPRGVDDPLPDRPKKIVKVTRALVRPPTVFSRRVGPEGSVGVIRLTEFAEATQPDFDAALDTMLADGVKALVL